MEWSECVFINPYPGGHYYFFYLDQSFTQACILILGNTTVE